MILTATLHSLRLEREGTLTLSGEARCTGTTVQVTAGLLEPQSVVVLYPVIVVIFMVCVVDLCANHTLREINSI